MLLTNRFCDVTQLTIYDTLSLTNSSLLTVDIILQNVLFSIDEFLFLSVGKGKSVPLQAQGSQRVQGS